MTEETLYAQIQRETREAVEAAHQWGRPMKASRPFLPDIRVCSRCGLSNTFAHANALTTCTPRDIDTPEHIREAASR